MTLSAKQIIADRVSTVAKEQDRRWTRLAALEDFYLSQQPRPISEAPKDGTEILGFASGEWAVVWWREELQRWIFSEAGHVFIPTHFIPLDALPLPEGE